MAGEIGVTAEANGGSAAFVGPPDSSIHTKLKLPADTGAAGKVLKVKSANHSSTNAELEWAADAGGEVVKIRTVRDGGNVSAITEDIDTSIYRAYNFIGAFKPVTDQAYLNFYWRAGDPKADLTASSYEWGVIYPYPDDNHYADAHHANAAMELLQNAGNSDREGWRLNLWMFPNVSGDAGPDISNFCTWHGARIDQSSDFRAGIGSGNYDAAANPNGFTIKPNTGNFAAYTYSLYGLKA